MASVDALQLRPLLDYLAVHPAPADEWAGWQIASAPGGANNRVMRVRGVDGDFAVKWTLRDARRRAEREYWALTALAGAGLAIAPEPVLLDTTSYALPVVVQRWIAGESLSLPETDGDWLALLAHHRLLHSITPQHSAITLWPAWTDADGPAACLALLRRETALLPDADRSARVAALTRRLKTTLQVKWPRPPLTLRRVDPSLSNFIQSAAGVVSIDWENSGWGDPAFDIAELITHPAYHAIAPERWTFVTITYGALADDAFLPVRVAAYRRTLLVWWVARLERMLLEVARGQDQRLVVRPPEWTERTRILLEHFAALAEAEL